MNNRYAVTIDGRVLSVEIEDAEGRLRVVVDGVERLLDARKVDGGGGGGGGGGSGSGVWSLLDGIDARLIHVDGVPPKLTVEVSHPDGEPRIATVQITDARPDPTAISPGGKQGPSTMRAPIPGRLVKVLVKAGDRVAAGQALLVLEAMKMENELRAVTEGIVSKVHVVEGATVETGQDLVSLG
jgi:glutaconyl-CoA/methylmalonyl-CoA decarboxylase subunit gamma